MVVAHVPLIGMIWNGGLFTTYIIVFLSDSLIIIFAFSRHCDLVLLRCMKLFIQYILYNSVDTAYWIMISWTVFYWVFVNTTNVCIVWLTYECIDSHNYLLMFLLYKWLINQVWFSVVNKIVNQSINVWIGNDIWIGN